MLDKKYKVGILTLDTYRIGAVEQLVWYAKKMKISIETVMDAQDFNKEMQALSIAMWCSSTPRALPTRQQKN